MPLQILYDEQETSNTGTYRNDFLIINTKNPGRFEQLYQDASLKMMKQFEQQIEERESELVGNTDTNLARELKEAEAGAATYDNTVDEKE